MTMRKIIPNTIPVAYASWKEVYTGLGRCLVVGIKEKDEKEIINNYPYRQVVAALIYLMILTRPYIAFALKSKTSSIWKYNECQDTFISRLVVS